MPLLKNAPILTAVIWLAGAAISANAGAKEFQLSTVEEVGPPEVVFDTAAQSCEPNDIPDTNARAFRDYLGRVHLFASHYTSRALIGPNLDSVKKSCEVVMSSENNADPSSYSDRVWLGSFFTSDGRRVVSLVHNEYHGWAHPGMCSAYRPRSNIGQCWWNTIGFAESNDGGISFRMPRSPGNLVASMPFRYNKYTNSGAIGYYAPSNILKVDNYYYAFINAWSNPVHKSGACLIRTSDLDDPRSWRAWDGREFGVRFLDPYEPGADRVRVEDRTCPPVYLGTVQSVVFHPASKRYIISEFTPDSRYGAPGLYVSTSSDLVHWTRPIKVVSTDVMLRRESPGRWKYDYFSLLDPNAEDMNFGYIGDTPYVYYVRVDLERAPLTRVLFRQRVFVKFVN